MVKVTNVTKLACVGLLLIFCLPLIPTGEAAPADWVPGWEPTPVTDWWDTQPESEVTSPYYDSIPYWQIAPTLHEIELTSDRVKVEVIGQSAGGRNIFLVTVAMPDVLNNLGHYRTLRHFMVDDPEKAQQMLDQFNDFRVPVYVHASVHGTEYPGADASLALIKTLAYSDDPEVLQILDNVIFLVNPVANPDGRVEGSYGNANYNQLNIDYVTATQPETLADIRVIRDWMPMVDLDLHGFGYNEMLIEPCTPPHNLNLEYDLYVKWALGQAEAMEASVYEHTGFSSLIPIRDMRNGWDDWDPIYQPMYSMYHGSYGATIETAHPGLPGVQADYWAVWGMLDFVVQNRMGMIWDQMEILKRGVLGLPQQPIPQEILDELKGRQYQKYAEFPEAYVIPATQPLQANPIDGAYLVDLLIFHGIEVHKAKASFKAAGVTYPSGTYVVYLKQALRGLTNVILSSGWDISYDYGVSPKGPSWGSWPNPLLLGVRCDAVWEPMTVTTVAISHADVISGGVASGGSAGYAYLADSNEAIRATNDLLKRGVPLARTTTTFKDLGTTYGVGTFVLSATVPGASAYASEIASRYKIQVYTLSKLPNAVQDIHYPKIAADVDTDFEYVLRDLGFSYDIVTWVDLNNGVDLSGYDVYAKGYSSNVWWAYPTLSKVGAATLRTFVANGGNYFGMCPWGLKWAADSGIADVSYKSGDSMYSGTVRVNYAVDNLVTAQYPANGYAYMSYPVWFTKYGSDMKVVGSLASDNFLVSGYWPHRDAAAGCPVILSKTAGDSNIVLMGIDPTCWAYPQVTYRLIANSMYLA